MAEIENTRDAVLSSATTPVKNVYVVGPFGARVSFASQQRRALNLVWALCRSKVIVSGNETDVAVIGGGIAGVTAAAALLSRGCNVTIIEERGSLLSLQRGGHHRMVHPTINFWPNDDLEWTTKLPFLDWFAGSSVAVVKDVTREWEKYFAGRTSAIVPNTAVSSFKFDPATKKVVIEVGAKPFREVDLALVATGFGVEWDMDDPLQNPYWTRDDIEDLAERTNIDLAVSGTGDGGVIDVLRLAYPGFMENEIALRYLQLEDRKSLQEAVKAAEAAARSEPDLDQRSELYAANYAGLAEARSLLAKALLPDLAPDKRRPLLIGRRPRPFEISSAPIHKIILAHALKRQHVDYVQGELQRETDGEYSVKLVDGSIRSLAGFERVLVRHGAKPPIERFFGEAEAVRIKEAQKNIGDFLRIPDARADFFNSDLHPHNGPRHYDFVDDRLPMARRLLGERFGLSAHVETADPKNIKFQAHLPTDIPGEWLGRHKTLPGSLFGIRLLPPASRRIPEASHLVAVVR